MNCLIAALILYSGLVCPLEAVKPWPLHYALTPDERAYIDNSADGTTFELYYFNI